MKNFFVKYINLLFSLFLCLLFFWFLFVHFREDPPDMSNPIVEHASVFSSAVLLFVQSSVSFFTELFLIIFRRNSPSSGEDK